MAHLDPQIQQYVDQRIQESLKAAGVTPGAPPRRNRLALIASKGTMDMAYPPLILASTAPALDMEAGIFFTFYGLYILHKKRGVHLQVPPLANPAMPIPIPNIVGVLPGMTAMATMMMNSWMSKVKVPSIPELLVLCRDSGVRLIACQMTMDVMDIKKEDLIDGIELGGAATFLNYASEAATTIFV